MPRPLIIAFENGCLPVVEELLEDSPANAITKAEARAIVALKGENILAMWNGENQSKIDTNKWVKLYDDQLYLGRYIGLISVGDLSLEIRPKVENKDKTGKSEFDVPLAPFLLFNLDHDDDAFLPTIGYGASGSMDHDFFDRHARQYIVALGKEISFGLRCGYTETESEVPCLRGRIAFERLAEVTTLRPHLLPCRFDEFSPDTLHNQVLKQALTTLVRRISNSELRNLGESLLLQLEYVSDTNYAWGEIKDLETDRFNARHDKLLRHAKLTIKSHFTFARSSNQKNNDAPHGFVMLWDIERLYERHAFKLLSKAIPDHVGTVVEKPARKYFLTESRNDFELQPDLAVISKDGRVILVVDTKWKTYGDNLAEVKKGDAYQMLAYANSLRERDTPPPPVVLLYPSGEPSPPKINTFTNLGSKFLVCSLPLNIKEGADGKVDYHDVDFEKIFGSELCAECQIAGFTSAVAQVKPATRTKRKKKAV